MRTGVIFAIAAFASGGAWGAEPIPAPSVDPWAVVSTTPVFPPGRFQIVLGSLNGAEQFLLDTATGQVWQVARYTAGRGQPYILSLMRRIDSLADEQKLVEDYGLIQQAPTPTAASSAVEPAGPPVGTVSGPALSSSPLSRSKPKVH